MSTLLRRVPTLILLASLFVFSNALRAAAPEPLKDGFTIVVMPDTQIYAWKFPEVYSAQTEWIAANAERYNMAYVIHVGDVTQNNVPGEWQIALDAHKKMAAAVPCAVVPGNHDLGPGGKAGARDTLMSDYFSVAEFRKMPTYGGVYDKEPERIENNYHLFSAGGRDWMILGLEFGPRHDVVRWANEVTAKHRDRSVIMVTHAYLRPDNKRFNRWLKLGPQKKPAGLDNYALAKSDAGFNDGEDLWKKLVSKHANMTFVLSGHVCYTGLLSSEGEQGNTVHQVLVDYQRDPQGGNGYLRLMQFSPDGVMVKVSDYSPYLDSTSQQAGAEFELKLAPAKK
ncbi:MAG: metallophosphoesterase [Verrucomicrobiae bacterium]|nr:metallophosphoesterase [Verrucomicrobiae bacterium]